MSDSAGSPATRNRIRLLIAIAVLVGAIILLVTVEWASIAPGGDEPPVAPEGSETEPALAGEQETSLRIDPGPTPQRAFAAGPASPPAPPPDAGASPLAARLNHAAGTIADDLEIVGEVLASYLESFGELPVGTNAEITAALSGDNSRGHAPLASGHTAVNKEGELVDRWGTPFFFHQISATTMELRSAGPDRMLYTEDDVVWGSAVEGDVPSVLAESLTR